MDDFEEKRRFGDEDHDEEEVSIGWRNLRYRATGWFGNEGKMILNRLNGYFEYHTLNGFMGPSGAGKTTLLNCLSGNRVQGLTPESEIYLNKDMHDGGKVTTYFIEQHVEKTIVGKMRVGQILRYAYRFKNGNDEGDMEQHIRKTIDELMLDENVLDRMFEQCSGGEQKRIAIAQELMSLRKPTLLFVDEPTTGLDSNAAHLLMQCLKQLATKHRMTVVTSIHVPSDDILNLFDKLYVLAKGGVCIYSGKPEKLRSHLETVIEDLVIQDEQPPIETLINIACSGITDPRVVTLSQHTLSAEYLSITERHLSKLNCYPNGLPNHRKLFSFNDLLLQISRLFSIIFVSNIGTFILMFVLTTVCLLFMVSLFDRNISHPNGCIRSSINAELYPDYNQSATVESSVCHNQIENDSLLSQNILFMGMSIFLYGLVATLICVTLFAPLVYIFQNEHRNHWYSLGVFYWSITIVTLFHLTLNSIFFSLFGYFYSGQHHGASLDWSRIGLFVLFIELLAIYSQSIGHLIGTLFMNYVDLGIVFTELVFILLSTFSGIFIDLEFKNNQLVSMIKDGLQFNSIFKGVLYALYGLERCDPDTEFSLVMVNYHVDPQVKVSQYCIYLAINIVVIRLVTLAYMYWKFNSFARRRSRKTGTETEMATIEIETKSNKSLQEVIQEANCQTKLVMRTKSEQEIKFEMFSRGKILIAWRDLSLFGTKVLFERMDKCEIEKESMDKAILKNLNGEFRFGTLNALMGTSGAGKTSLLKVLNGRDKARLSGATQFYLSKFTRIQTCFIAQDVSGHLLPGLTAKQTLVYASRLKNAQLREFGVDTSKIDHQQIVLNLLDELGLSDTVNTLVEKCSGGERKRLALAAELTALQMPNLICIDEPTSGLDSNSAEVVVACLRKLTQAHSITIVASIHQPNTEVLQMFDQIYVLARGGVCIYSGAPTTILPHLQSVPEISHDNKFPIETLIKHSCHTYPNSIVDKLISTNQRQFIQSIVASGLLSEQTQFALNGVQQNRRRFSLEDTSILCARYWAYVCGYLWIEWAAFGILCVGYAYFLFLFFDSSIAKPSGCISLDEDFNNTCAKSEEKLFEDTLITYNFQFLYFAFALFFSIAILKTTLSFAYEMVYFINEHRNGWYSTGSFYLCKCLFDTLLAMVAVLVYAYICNIYQSVIAGIYPNLVLIIALSLFAYHPVSYISSQLAGNRIPPLTIVSITIFFLFVFLCNYFIPISRVHYFYRLLSHLSPIRFMLESLILMLYGFGRCQPKQLQPLLYLLSLEDSDYYRNMLWLLVLIVVYNVLALWLLIYQANPEQNQQRNSQRLVAENLTTLDNRNKLAAIPGIGSPNHFSIKLIRF